MYISVGTRHLVTESWRGKVGESTLRTKVGKLVKRTRLDIVPTWAVGSQFFVNAGFRNVGPSWGLKLSRTLEMWRRYLNEIFCVGTKPR